MSNVIEGALAPSPFKFPNSFSLSPTALPQQKDYAIWQFGILLINKPYIFNREKEGLSSHHSKITYNAFPFNQHQLLIFTKPEEILRSTPRQTNEVWWNLRMVEKGNRQTLAHQCKILGQDLFP